MFKSKKVTIDKPVKGALVVTVEDDGKTGAIKAEGGGVGLVAMDLEGDGWGDNGRATLTGKNAKAEITATLRLAKQADGTANAVLTIRKGGLEVPLSFRVFDDLGGSSGSSSGVAVDGLLSRAMRWASDHPVLTGVGVGGAVLGAAKWMKR